MNDSRPRNSKRRWYQFSVRTVLIGVLVLSLFFSWLGSRLQRAAKSRAALAELHRVALEISSLGGDIDCKYAERRPNGLEQLLGDPGVFDIQKVCMGRASEADLQLLRGLNGMLHSWELGLSRSGVTDAELKHLQTLTGLRELDLSTTRITDAGLKHLHGLSSLRVLRLKNTQVTAAGISDLQEALPNARIIPGLSQLTAIAEIKKAGGAFYWPSPRVIISFPRLHHLDTDAVLVHVEAFGDLGEQMYLNLTGTQIGDDGMERLERLTQLRALMLGNTQITDAGLVHLKQLTGLRNLILRATAVTGEGTWSMQQALPKCRIRH